ncbi:restriction endonuclease subunit S [Nocardia sp. NPDC005745]|uniref:restriction endonuclease subunit S n=1 Tax=Nocardia sp. NPDC005745 TaxID=3157061 RepID=UPI0033CE9E8D
MILPTVPLGELCEINIGRTPSRSERSYWGKGFPWLSIADMNQGPRLVDTKEQITPLAAKSIGKPVTPGTVALSFKLSIGKVGVIQQPMYTNEAIATLPIRDNKKILPNYLAWTLRTIDLLTESDNAAMGKTLNKAKLARLQIPVPDLTTQRRITDVLDRVDELREKRRKSIALLDDLTQSIFLDMFGTANYDWPVRTVEDLAAHGKNSIRTGPFGSQLLHGEFVDEGIPVLGIDNAVDNEFKWGRPRYITDQKYRKLSRYTVLPGDVLITIMGTCGRCAVVPDNIPTAINTKHLCCITLDRKRCLPEYLHSYFLRHPTAQNYLQQTAKGAIMAGLNMGIIKSLPVSIPPLELQERYSQQIQHIRHSKAVSERHLESLNALFASIQSRAFRGELWQDDLKDL